MGTIIICILVAAAIAAAVISTIKRVRHGSSCCGERDPLPKKIKVEDKNTANYPFNYKLKIDGMHCQNCVRHVENALNSKKGFFAKVNLEKKEADLYTKSEVSQEELREIISKEGFLLEEVEKK
ncbi:MAG: heavy-metal-associated domain-containing protein [Treponema sp.]|nr:heavy-metal-associated domain-containing protein [Treponema sp.]